MTPGEFEIARKRLWDELVQLHDCWDQYATLFSDQSRLTVLNACAPRFFATVQRVLLREVILGISRLTDPRAQGPFTNLALDTLLLDPALPTVHGLATRLASAITSAKAAAEPIRQHRNKYIAHLDHVVATGDLASFVPGLKRTRITEAIQLMEKSYNCWNGEVRHAHAAFELSSTGGPDRLIEILEDSAHWRRHQALMQ